MGFDNRKIAYFGISQQRPRSGRFSGNPERFPTVPEGCPPVSTRSPGVSILLPERASARLVQSITDLGGKQSIQSGGAYGEESDRQKDLRGQVEDFLGDINETAAAIAADTEDPALMNRFRMPGDGGDTGLARPASRSSPPSSTAFSKATSRSSPPGRPPATSSGPAPPKPPRHPPPP